MAEGDDNVEVSTVSSNDNINQHNGIIDDDVVENGIDDQNFSDPEDFVDDITDEELLADKLRHKPRELDGFDNIIVVDRIPEVGPDRFEKLSSVLVKLFMKYGTVKECNYPKDEEGKTKGYVFVAYENRNEAQAAAAALNNHQLDKKHNFIVNSFLDIDKYVNIPDEWSPPNPQPYVDKGNLRSWLLDKDFTDQYVVVYEEGSSTAVFSNTIPEQTLKKERKMWTETAVSWSPLGTYLATFHKKGIALWGGEEFNQLARFAHEGVNLIDFSPCESYLVTFSNQLAAIGDPNAIIVWDLRSSLQKRAFPADSETLVWPVFKWSPDGKYFAKISSDKEGVLSVYVTPSMELLDKKSLKTPGIKNFSWSPTQNILAYWVAENKDVPARVALIEMPSRNEIRAKNLFSVADCRMHWQNSGEYLCVKVDRYAKAKKEKTEVKYSGLYYNFEIFHMKEKQIPVDSIEIKENIVAFAWEPVGNKFSIIHGDGPQYSVSFYGINAEGNVTALKKFESKQCNHLFWSPNGQFLVLANLRTQSSQSVLEFVDTSDFTITASSEHYLTSDVEWDPSGRYVVTGVSWWAHKTDNSYWLWTFQGRVVRKHDLEGFCQLLWRPRPKSLLNEEQIKEIKKNLKKYSQQFDIKDRMAMSKVSKEILEKRKKLMTDFRTYRERREEDYQLDYEKRCTLRDDQIDDNEGDEEETIEFFIKEEIVEAEE